MVGQELDDSPIFPRTALLIELGPEIVTCDCKAPTDKFRPTLFFFFSRRYDKPNWNDHISAKNTKKRVGVNMSAGTLQITRQNFSSPN